MPRPARVIVPGFAHHIVQRGHDRQLVPVERRDFEYYLENLRRGSRSVSMRCSATA